MALLLDNAFTAAQVRPLLPSAAGSLVVVTSRRQLTGLVVDGADLHRVDVLDTGSAVELLDRASGGSRVGNDLDAARHLVGLCAFLPLAVCLAAAQLAARPRQAVSAIADTLSKGEGPVELLRVEGEAAIRTALDESYRTLAPELAGVYRRLGLLPVARFDVPLVAATCGTTRASAQEALSALAEINLLEELGEEYRFHDLVGQHARLQAQSEEPAEAAGEALRRFVDWCLAGASAAEALLSSRYQDLTRDYVHEPEAPPAFDGPAAALRWLAGHLPTVMAAVRHCRDVGWDAACWQLVDALWPAFLRLRPAELWVEAHEIGLEAARREGNRRAVSRMLTSGGNGLRNIGRDAEAAQWYLQALRQAEEDGDSRQRAQALQGLGNVRLATGNLSEAEDFFRQALALREEVGYHRGAALSRLCLGQVSLERGDHHAAADRLGRAHGDLLAAGDVYDAMRSLAFLGLATALGGDPEAGRSRLRQALSGMEAAGSPQWQARILEMLGRVAQHAGATTEARDWYERSVALYRDLRPAEARRIEDRLGAL
ncbi:tetratricopeptide repeat protein [Streptomyces hoynatensis]|uniref:Tetratricopeptide repeat protein n=1 Tax=Streptomyces hoynatensis TaxID=1141874 RepID=A0A3A9ZFE6_9ACTN|nr:tetratricopeptide repeat protein [Streptomyces hoynatensis]